MGIALLQPFLAVEPTVLAGDSDYFHFDPFAPSPFCIRGQQRRLQGQNPLERRLDALRMEVGDEDLEGQHATAVPLPLVVTELMVSR
jgi:hypothetical protein